MNHNVPPIIAKPILAIMLFVCIVLVGAIIPISLSRRNRFGFNREKFYLFTVGNILLAIAVFLYAAKDILWAGISRDGVLHFSDNGILVGRANPDSVVMRACYSALIVLAGLPLLVKLYQAWLAGQATDAEKSPGKPGFRAWFSIGNICIAVILSFAFENVFECTFIMPLGLILLALAAYPLVQTLGSMNNFTDANQSRESRETLNAERDKVLAMVESNKITAEEGVELLNALGASGDPAHFGSSYGSQASHQSSPQFRTAALLGAALVLVGFFLPWITVDVNKEVQRFGDSIGNSMSGQGLPFGPTAQNFIGNLSTSLPQTKIEVAGADVPHGVGWAILLLSVAIAAMPLFTSQITAEIQQRIELLALAVGAVLLVYFCADSWRYISIGFLLALAGYVIQGANTSLRLGGFRAIGNLVHDHV